MLFPYDTPAPELKRALDQTVREVRLGTGHTYTHAQLKQMICDRTTILGDCSTMLHLGTL